MQHFFITRGADRWYELSFFSMCDGLFTVVIQNITDRKRAGEKLRINEVKYKTLFEVPPCASNTLNNPLLRKPQNKDVKPSG